MRLEFLSHDSIEFVCLYRLQTFRVFGSCCSIRVLTVWRGFFTSWLGKKKQNYTVKIVKAEAGILNPRDFLFPYENEQS